MEQLGRLGLSIWPFIVGFITIWYSPSTSWTRMEAVKLREVWARKLHNITFATFYWTKQVKRPAQIQRVGGISTASS